MSVRRAAERVAAAGRKGIDAGRKRIDAGRTRVKAGRKRAAQPAGGQAPHRLPPPSHTPGRLGHWEDWRAGGSRITLSVPVGGRVASHHVFVRATDAPAPPKSAPRIALWQSPKRVRKRIDEPPAWTTFLHGFPTSSHDWSPVSTLLPTGRPRLYLDLLGFGDSDKPRGHRYSFEEQIALLDATWRRFHVESTGLVVHDYSVSIAQELLARVREGMHLGPRIRWVAFLNGGLFYSRQRRLPIQRLLRSRVVGPVVANLASRRTFDASMHRILHPSHALAEGDVDELWSAITRRHGRGALPRLSAYHAERRADEPRWTHAVRSPPVPVRYLWGLHDPVSGQETLERVEEVARDPDVVAWPDVGHYPHLEVPERVARELAELERTFG